MTVSDCQVLKFFNFIFYSVIFLSIFVLQSFNLNAKQPAKVEEEPYNLRVSSIALRINFSKHYLCTVFLFDIIYFRVLPKIRGV